MRIYRFLDADNFASLQHPTTFGRDTVSRLTRWQPIKVEEPAKLLTGPISLQKIWLRHLELKSLGGSISYRLQFALAADSHGKQAGNADLALRVRFRDFSWQDCEHTFTMPANWKGHLIASMPVKVEQLEAGIQELAPVPQASR